MKVLVFFDSGYGFNSYAIMQEKEYFDFLKKVDFLHAIRENEWYSGIKNCPIFFDKDNFDCDYISIEQEKTLRALIFKGRKTLSLFPLNFVLNSCKNFTSFEMNYTICDIETNGKNIGEDEKGKYYICSHCGEKVYDIYKVMEYYGDTCPICKTELQKEKEGE